jgi:hypothetical protein
MKCCYATIAPLENQFEVSIKKNHKNKEWGEKSEVSYLSNKV